MVFDILYFLPVFVCLIWTMTFMFKNRTPRQNMLLVCLGIASLYYIAYGFFTMPTSDYHLMTILESICMPLALLLLATLAIYVSMLTNNKIDTWQAILTLPCIILASSLWTLYYVIGYSEAAEFYTEQGTAGALSPEHSTRLFKAFNFVGIGLVQLFSIGFIILIICLCVKALHKMGYKFGDYYREFRQKKKVSPIRAIPVCIMMVMVLMIPVAADHAFVMGHPALGITLSICICVAIHLLCINENNTEIEDLADETLRKAKLYDKIMEEYYEKEQNKAIVKQLEKEDEEDDSDTLKDRRIQNTLINFKSLMEDEKLFLDDGLTITDVAKKLGMGRTTLSTVLNGEYGTNFRGILNKYRIEYAKTYLKANPTATQEQVAFASGFKDASAFSHKFKELTGKTPLAWLINQKGRTP